MNATGNFDAALQLTQPAIGRILTAMHRAGAATHDAGTVTGGDIIELLVNVPTITLDTSGAAAPPNVAAHTATRILYHARPVNDPANVGISAACDVNLRARARIGDGSAPAGAADPAPVGPDSCLLTDYTDTLAADIVVHGVAGSTVTEVQDTLLGTIHAQRGAYPLDFMHGSGIAEAAGAVIDRSPDTPVVAVGLNFAARAGASSTHLTTSICQQDWALALSADYLIEQLLARLANDLGNLPPPYGQVPVLIETSPGAHVYLDTFSVIVGTGKIDITGVVRRVAAGPFGTITANWTATITLALNSAQRIEAAVSEPDVQLYEWYAVVGNFVTGGQIATTVAQVIHDQLAGGLANTGVDSLVSATVGRIAASGTTANVPIGVHAADVEIRPDAIVVHGTITTLGTPEPPHVALTAMQGHDPGRLTLHAGGSWAPGGELTSIAFDFGDGSNQTSAGPNAALVTDHTYIPGAYNACVTITDQLGRTASTCVAVQPGMLIVEPRDSPTWEFCSSAPTLTFDVTSSGSGVPAAIITVSGSGWAVTAETDTQGVAQLTLDPQQVQSHGIAAAPPSIYHLGAVHVDVAKPGWVGRQTTMWMVDCDALFAAKLGAIAHRNEVLDRLAGYRALRDLLDKYGHNRPDPSTILGPNVPTKSPKDSGYEHLEHAVDLLTRIEKSITDGGDVLPAAAILGIGPGDPEATANLQRRIGELWDGVGQAAGRWDERYGPNGPRP
jgi:hypothetical protein